MKKINEPEINEKTLELFMTELRENFLNNEIEIVAKVCHNVNKMYCESQGDYSQKDWNEAPEWQKESSKKGVELHLENENTTPADSHNSWLEEKRKEGWVYGEIKDADKKTHPCFVPFEELPANQKAKDYIFKAIVDNLKNNDSERKNHYNNLEKFEKKFGKHIIKG